MHFTCRAELPIGSSLRITGPTLWSPSATGLQATSSTTPTAAISTASAATPTTAAAGGAADASTFSTALASSVAAATAASHAIDESILAANCLSSMTTVELITTPETYPIWKTKTPVVIVLHKTKAQQIQHYYYRYFVMTPGATMEEYILTPNNNNKGKGGGGVGEDTTMADSDQPGAAAATPYSMPTPVLMWENPFENTLGGLAGGGAIGSNNKMHSALSTQSLQTGPSLYPAAGFSPGAAASGTTSSTPFKELANLPYRTLDIHVGTGTIMNNTTTSGEDGVVTTTGETEGAGSGSGGGTNPIAFVPLDNWNKADDDTFRAYQIRESMERQQQQQLQQNPSKILMKQISDVSDDFSMSDDNNTDTTGTGTGPHSKDKTAPPQQIYFICFHLPVVVVKVNGTTWKASWSESLLAQKEGSMIANTYRAHWVGTVTTHPPISSQEDMDQVRKLLNNMDCTPIFLPDHIRHAHYYGFCKQVLWPAFHNIDLLDLSTMKRVNDGKSSGAGVGGGGGDTADAAGGGDAAIAGGGGSGSKSSTASDWDQSRLDDWWNAYKTVNQEFATVVQNLVQDPDNTYLWIHDYHLSLLPRYLQMANPGEDEDSDSAIALQQQQQQQLQQQQDSTPPSGTPTPRTGRGGGGLSSRTVFFLHIPFPTSQIFRELECGQSILEGMLHADVVGFHAFDHARHFLNAAKRILGLNYESLVGGLIGVNFMGKTVLVSMSNVSIEPRMVDGK